MSAHIDNLVDDCLLCIFDFLDPLNLVSVAQVCTRWGQLSQKKLELITEVHFNEPRFCHGYDPDLKYATRLISTNADVMKSALRYIEQHVKSVTLGDCEMNTIYLNSQYGYTIGYDFEPEEFISMLFQTFTNIAVLEIKNTSIISSKKLVEVLKSNRSDGTFNSVEKVVWKVNITNNFNNFQSLFPNMKKLTLFIDDAPLNQIESIISSNLRDVKHIKSFVIDIHHIATTRYLTHHSIQDLSNISVFSQLEELEIWNDWAAGAEYNSGSVNKLLKTCPNLRVIRLSELDIGPAELSSFLAMSKLEQLYIYKSSDHSTASFNNIGSNQFEHLTIFIIDFEINHSSNFSGLSNAIAKMPALKYLMVTGLPEKKTTELTYRVIVSREFNEDIVVLSDKNATYETIRVRKNVNQELKSEALRLYISCQERDYSDIIYKFVKSLEHCSVIISEKNIRRIREQFFGEPLEIDHSACTCYY